MVFRDKNGKVTGVKVKYNGAYVYATVDMLAGRNKNCDLKEIAKALELGDCDSETREAITEMYRRVVEAGSGVN